MLAIVALAILSSCSNEKRRGRIDYTAIKEKAGISGTSAEEFDKITDEYSAKAKQLFEENKKNNKKTSKEDREQIAAEQDQKIKAILTAEQFTVYAEEVKIERMGRDTYNMALIKDSLKLDSAQAVAFEQTNAAFNKTMRDNHDSYHGKPDVYKQFYAELDVSRRSALEKILTESQYQTYLNLVEKYKIGQSGER